MSLMTKGIGFVKKAKHARSERQEALQNAVLSPVRRIERVATKERICAMTFDDGPCRLPPSNDPNGAPLTVQLVEILEQHGAKGTFDVVGDTSNNYPDEAGKNGGATWGGKRYDHYPDIHKDSEGGVLHCLNIARRILEGGHELTNHTYSHVLFGRKNLVYGSRSHFTKLEQVTEDIQKLHALVQKELGCEMTLSRPPHYVDQIEPGISSYDAYALTGYQYMAASFDGAGWLPLSSYEDEVKAVWQPTATQLAANPDYFCGQIIFHKDGFNMARRTPVADGLPLQLAELTRHGYRVVTVSELLRHSTFRDVEAQHPAAQAARTLLDAGWCVAFRDNTIRPETVLTRGSLAMMAYGCYAAQSQVDGVRSGKAAYCSDVPRQHPYCAAIEMAGNAGALSAEGGRFSPDRPVTEQEMRQFCQVYFQQEDAPVGSAPYTHGTALLLLASL
ncbi:MAG: polysaccharide deacetylase family protein [Oscillospiraceae bacterium]|nr:polysaccharide deacetylase family protein [Oscillospiraceae bacterium]